MAVLWLFVFRYRNMAVFLRNMGACLWLASLRSNSLLCLVFIACIYLFFYFVYFYFHEIQFFKPVFLALWVAWLLLCHIQAFKV